MSDAWDEIQAIKSKRISLREKLQKRKKEREDILNLSGTDTACSSSKTHDTSATCVKSRSDPVVSTTSSPILKLLSEEETEDSLDSVKGSCLQDLEETLLASLCQVSLALPVSAAALLVSARRPPGRPLDLSAVTNLLQKFSTQQLITISDCSDSIQVTSVDQIKIGALLAANSGVKDDQSTDTTKRKAAASDEVSEAKHKRTDIMSLLAMPSAREKETKKIGEEILDLLSKPTAKERSLAERFRSDGAGVMEFCSHGTRAECSQAGDLGDPCSKLHFKKIIQKHTDESLGDCSFLNTCFHMDTCKYVHYEVDGEVAVGGLKPAVSEVALLSEQTRLYPAQWIQCDLRYLDMAVLGKFSVVMADPPWDIHMELPYGTMSDDEMRQLGVPQLQEQGLIFLWVTGRAMELGRECLHLWGYERVDEIIWVKTNQLQRIIRTGRTGHWLNHGKEHCLVGRKGDISSVNRGLDCDVIVAEVRATSHKPDEIYGIIERLSPGTRKIELFGRPHNVQPNWITLGNQVEGVRLVDPELIQAFSRRYPDANCMAPSKAPAP